MQIKNLNAPPPSAGAGKQAPVETSASTDAVRAAPDACSTPSSADAARATEIELLRARIEHLELVVETARGLMTANQERLLRRLHDVPHEMMLLTAKMTRFTAADPERPDVR
jgi:hypothetical protein